MGEVGKKVVIATQRQVRETCSTKRDNKNAAFLLLSNTTGNPSAFGHDLTAAHLTCFFVLDGAWMGKHTLASRSR